MQRYNTLILYTNGLGSAYLKNYPSFIRSRMSHDNVEKFIADIDKPSSISCEKNIVPVKTFIYAISGVYSEMSAKIILVL